MAKNSASTNTPPGDNRSATAEVVRLVAGGRDAVQLDLCAAYMSADLDARRVLRPWMFTADAMPAAVSVVVDASQAAAAGLLRRIQATASQSMAGACAKARVAALQIPSGRDGQPDSVGIEGTALRLTLDVIRELGGHDAPSLLGEPDSRCDASAEAPPPSHPYAAAFAEEMATVPRGARDDGPAWRDAMARARQRMTAA